MSKFDKTYWREAFCEALEMEFHEYRHVLTFQREVRLSEEALRMDALIIKKDAGVTIEKDIGRIFRGYNIFEYKSEADSFSVWDYNKLMGYVNLYSALKKIPLTNITASIVLTKHPKTVIEYLQNERSMQMTNPADGVYYFNGEVVPMQILRSKELSAESNAFLQSLRSDLSGDALLRVLGLYEKQRPIDKRQVYIDRLFRANRLMLEEAGENMSEEACKIYWEVFGNTDFVQARVRAKTEEALHSSAQNNALKIAQRLLLRGNPIDEIADITELPPETIRNLQANLA